MKTSVIAYLGLVFLSTLGVFFPLPYVTPLLQGAFGALALLSGISLLLSPEGFMRDLADQLKGLNTKALLCVCIINFLISFVFLSYDHNFVGSTVLFYSIMSTFVFARSKYSFT